MSGHIDEEDEIDSCKNINGHLLHLLSRINYSYFLKNRNNIKVKQGFRELRIHLEEFN